MCCEKRELFDMSCAGCLTNNVKPVGCKSHGNCLMSCNKKGTFDFLSNISFPQNGEAEIVQVSFNKGSRKEFFINEGNLDLIHGDEVIVSAQYGYDYGEVSMMGEMARLQVKKYQIKPDAELRKILRKPTVLDRERYEKAKQHEKSTMLKTRLTVRKLGLQMKIGQVEYQGDGKKATFYYIADGRVDFRELIKILASDFHVKIEMRQIGARQEAGKVGGIGSCGRELCCSTWLTNFKSVSTSAARYQQLSINQSKLSGQCGRLKCCLNYELDAYIDALNIFPDKADTLHTKEGNAHLLKIDVFGELMYYIFPEKNKYYRLKPGKVKQILEMNRNNNIPASLDDFEVKTIEKEKEYEDVVGQISLESLNRSAKKQKRRKAKGKRYRKSNRK